ncbi:MAG TPA: PRC-barrel domain-containing protein [Nitrospira sp.]|nr:PRC-barrel domain-containing protein [Nitrospira sp.]
MKQFRRVRDLTALTLHATDGELGRVVQLYFDDRSWAVRYLVVQTGGWLLGRQVLIAPVAVEDIDDGKAVMRLALTKRQVEQAPPADKNQPPTRRYEEAYYRHFSWVPYWQPGPGIGGTKVTYPATPPMALDVPLSPDRPDQHLRGGEDIAGFGIHARDGEIGHVEDLVFDDEDWIVRYVEVDTRNWLPGKKVLVQTGRIERIDWERGRVSMALSRQAIESAPAYDPSELITPEYEIELFKHYGKEAA